MTDMTGLDKKTDITPSVPHDDIVRGGQKTCAAIEAIFTQIENMRMDGVPILNKALSVKAIGFEQFQERLVGVLLTPWFMNLMMVSLDPIGEGAATDFKVGDKINFDLAGGRFEFIAGFEEQIGPYWACSLFSPVFEFSDQESAVQTAQSVYDMVMSASKDEMPEQVADDNFDTEEHGHMQTIMAGGIPVLPQEGEMIVPSAAKESSIQPSTPSSLSRRELFRGRQGQSSKTNQDKIELDMVEVDGEL